MKTRLNIFIKILIFVLPNLALAQTNEELNKIKSSASQQAVEFLNRIPKGQEQQYGFKDRSEISKVTVGEPYAVYTLVSGNLQQISQYRVPVLIGAEYKGLLTLMKVDNGWKVVDFGANVLAKEIQQFEIQNKCSTTTCKRVILRLLDVKCDFVSIDGLTTQIKDHQFFPLQSAKEKIQSKNMKVSAGTSYSLSEVIQITEKK